MKRLGLSGCGAVARCYYAPAIKLIEPGGKLKLVGAFDPDPAAARLFLKSFPDAAQAATLDSLLGLDLDYLIVASPPSVHREQAINALRRGVPVHCEKPLATSVEDGLAMIAEAEKSGARLSVNMVRRKLASARAIGSMLRSGSIGELRSIDIFEGGPFSWPVQSQAYFDRSSGAVGVLDDLGTHALDLLCSWLGAAEDLIYCDDEMGGVAANCRIEANFGTARARIRLSRDWFRPNTWKFIGSGGSITWDRESDDVEAQLGSSFWRLSAPLNDEGQNFEKAFATPIEAIANGDSEQSYVLAAEVLPALEAVETCKKVRTTMPMPWLK
jgi:predicted dehydrogenase